MSNHHQTESDNRATLPNRNMEWAEAVVKWTRYEYVAVYDYPTTHDNETVMEIYTGDVIQVSLRYRREDWCLCKVGHVLGWVFLQDVRFIIPQVRKDSPRRPRRRRTQQLSENSSAPSRSQHDVYETETEPVIPTHQYMQSNEPELETQVPASAPVASVSSDKKPMIQRLIKFFKG